MKKFLLAILIVLSMAGVGTGVFLAVNKNTLIEEQKSQSEEAEKPDAGASGSGYVYFYPNGGAWSDGSTGAKSYYFSSNTTVGSALSSASPNHYPPTKSGSYFLGWTTTQNGSTHKLRDDTVSSTTYVYALWGSGYTVTMKTGDSNITSFWGVWVAYNSSYSTRQLFKVGSTGTAGTAGYTEIYNIPTSNYGIAYHVNKLSGTVISAVHQDYSTYSSTAHNQYFNTQSSDSTWMTYYNAITTNRTYTLYGHKYFSRTTFGNVSSSNYANTYSSHEVPQISWSWNTSVATNGITFNGNTSSCNTTPYIAAWKSTETSRTSYGSRMCLKIYVPTTTNISFTVYYQGETSYDKTQISEISTSSSAPDGFTNVGYNSTDKTKGKYSLGGVGQQIVDYGNKSAGTYYVWVKFSTDTSSFYNASGFMMIPNFSFVYRGGYIGYSSGGTSGSSTYNSYVYYCQYGDTAKMFYKDNVSYSGQMCVGYYTGSNGSGTRVYASNLQNSSAIRTIYPYMKTYHTVTYDANGGVMQNGSSTQNQYVFEDLPYATNPVPSASRTGFDLYGWAFNYATAVWWNDYTDMDSYAQEAFDQAGVSRNSYLVWARFTGGDYVNNTGILFKDGYYYTFAGGLQSGSVQKKGIIIAAGRGSVDYVRHIPGGKMEYSSSGYDRYYSSVYFYMISSSAWDGPSSKCTIREWTSGMGAVYNDGSDLQGENVYIPKDHTLLAVWGGKSYTLTFDTNGSGAATPSGVTVTYAQSLNDCGHSLPSANNVTGYYFNGWYTQGDGSGGTWGTHVTNDTIIYAGGLDGAEFNHSSRTLRLYARYDPQTYYCTLNRNGGSGGTTQAKITYTSTYAYNSSGGNLTAPTRTGYTFQGWGTSGGTVIFGTNGYLNPSISGYTNSSRQWINSSSPTLYAIWSANSYPLLLRYISSSTSFAPGDYLDTGYTIDWSKDVDIGAEFSFSDKAAGSRLLIFGDFCQGSTNCLNVEITADRKLRFYMQNTSIAYDQTYNSVLSYETSYNVSFSKSGAHYRLYLNGTLIFDESAFSISGNSYRTLRFGAADQRGSSPFGPITLTSAYLFRQTPVTYSSTYGTLPTTTRSDYWNHSAWKNGSTSVTASTTWSPSSISTPIVLDAAWARTMQNIYIYLRTVDETRSSITSGGSGSTVSTKYYNSSGSQVTSSSSSASNGPLSAWIGHSVIFTATPASGYVYIGYTISDVGVSGLPLNNNTAGTTTATVSAENTVYYLYFQKTAVQLKYTTQRGGYWYYEDGYFPQTLVTDSSLISQLNSKSASTTVNIGYNENTWAISAYYYNSNYYVNMTNSVTVKLNKDTTPQTYNGKYWFKIEPIRWRVTPYGTGNTYYKLGQVVSDLCGVSDFLGFGMMSDDLGGSAGCDSTELEGYQLSNSNMGNFGGAFGSYSASTISKYYYKYNAITTTTKISSTTHNASQASNTMNVATDRDIKNFTNVMTQKDGDTSEPYDLNDKYYSSDFSAFMSGQNYDGSRGWTAVLYNLYSGYTIDATGTFESAYFGQYYGAIYCHKVTRATSVN